jgi:transglutaminase-like putative cysteine protease
LNGSGVDQAVKSIDEIDNTTKKITEGEKTSTGKAKKIYAWITKNIENDEDKAEKIGQDPKGIPTGAVVAYSVRKGVSYDFACLFVAMCRAVDVEVNFVTGKGYNGIVWGDHAWNQIYSTEERKWINVDTLFGIVGNYFDKSQFNFDHLEGEVQKSWESK